MTQFKSSLAYPPLLLCSGSFLAIFGQLIMNMNAVHSSAQLLPLSKYAAAMVVYFLARTLSPNKQSQGNLSPVARLSFQAALGLLDVVAYSLYCFGFSHLGSAISSVVFSGCQQVFTALTRRFLLRKQMPKLQCIGVFIVVIGLLTRGFGQIDMMSYFIARDSQASPVQSMDSGVTYALLLIGASAFAYSLLGVLYEKYTQLEGPNFNLKELSMTMATIGFLFISLYELVFVLPKMEMLIIQPFVASGQPLLKVLCYIVIFGGTFAVHQGTLQARVFQYHGAMTVGIVNALRAATVAVLSHVLFCAPSSAHQCLTFSSGASAVIVSLGALLYTLAGVIATTKEKVA